MYGRADAGVSCTIATHQPAATIVRHAEREQLPDPAAEARRSGDEVREAEAGQHEECLELLGEEREARRARR